MATATLVHVVLVLANGAALCTKRVTITRLVLADDDSAPPDSLTASVQGAGKL